MAEAGHWGRFEEGILAELSRRNTPVIVVFNKRDVARPGTEILDDLRSQKLPVVQTVAHRSEGLSDLREALIRSAPEAFMDSPPVLGDLISPGDLVVLVVPIDLEAPRGRLILPQVQSIRDVLDHEACCLVVKERELRDALDKLKNPPALVVTDSQAFLRVAGDTPSRVPMTTFSILFARLKGDLHEFVRGARAIDRLQAGSRTLVMESCTHYPIGDDIGCVKIPCWFRQYSGVDLEFVHRQGDFPEDPGSYQLVVQCGSCMRNRREVISRICTAGKPACRSPTTGSPSPTRWAPSIAPSRPFQACNPESGPRAVPFPPLL